MNNIADLSNGVIALGQRAAIWKAPCDGSLGINEKTDQHKVCWPVRDEMNYGEFSFIELPGITFPG